MDPETKKAATDAGSPEAVAYRLLQWLEHMESFKNRADLLDAYAECLQATKGSREARAGLAASASSAGTSGASSWSRPMRT